MTNPSKLSPTIGAGNELAFLIYNCSPQGFNSFINLKQEEGGKKYISYPVSIADECHQSHCDYNSNLRNVVYNKRQRRQEAFTPKFLRAAHYIGVSATLNETTFSSYNSVNSYILRRSPLTELVYYSENNQIDLFHRYYASVTNTQNVEELKELYKRIKILKVVLPVHGGDNLQNQLQSPDIVFKNFKQTLDNVGVKIPDSFKKNFRLTDIKKLCEETIEKLKKDDENARVTRSSTETPTETVLEKKINKIRNLYPRLNISDDKKNVRFVGSV